MSSLDPVSSVVIALKRDRIIPDVIPDTFTPSLLFSIIYPNGKEVLLGNEFEVTETDDEPLISFTPLNMPTEIADSCGDANDEPSYTLAMVDPDAPSKADPLYKSFRHWLITGLKSPRDAASKAADLMALETKAPTTPYRPPGPRPGSGLHRYTFLIFQDPHGAAPFVVPEGSPEYGAALEERRSWNAVEFAEKYGLKLVGANFFVMRSEEA